jgi:hypothetical protein
MEGDTMSPSGNDEIAAQNRQFFEDAKAALELVLKWHDANPHCGGGSLPGSKNRTDLHGVSWDDYAYPELKDGSFEWKVTSYDWTWSDPSTREQSDDGRTRLVHSKYSVHVTYHWGGDLEIECGDEDVTPEGYEGSSFETLMGHRYPREVWSREHFLADTLAAAFAAPRVELVDETPFSDARDIDWGGEDRLNDPYGNPNW